MDRHEAFMGDDGAWGVECQGAVLYEADFTRAQAEALADMENSDNPPKDWEEAERRLKRMGLL